MKKRFLSFLTLGAAFVLMTMNACTNEIQEVVPGDNHPPSDTKEVKFIANDFLTADGVQTRVALTPGEENNVKKATFAWTVGDTIGILPSDGAQVYFRINEIDENNPKSATFTGGSWGLKSGEHNYAAYYPFIQDIMLDRTKVPVDYTTQTYTATQDGTVSPSHDYMAAKPVQRGDGGLNFVFTHLGALVEAKFTLPAAAEVKQLTLVSESAVFPVKGTFDLTAENVAITPEEGKETFTMTVQVEELSAAKDEQVSVFFMMPPMASVEVDNLSAMVVYSVTENEEAKEYRLPLDITALKAPDGTKATQFEAQKYYTLETSAIETPESIEIKYPSTLSANVNTALGTLGGTKLRFVTISTVVSETVVYTDDYECKAYAVRNGDWLEVHTLAKSFKLPREIVSMFHGNVYSNFAKLTELDLSGFNTENVTHMNLMFYGCSSLTSLDLSSFNTAGVMEMHFMFYGCSSLTSLDLRSFNTAQVTDMSYMFAGCSSLTELDLSKFNTAEVTKMDFMFYGCSSLTSLNLSSFNTAKVTDMSFMFYDCSSLTELDLSSFTFVDDGDYTTMFNNVGYNSYSENNTTAKIYVTQAGYNVLTAIEGYVDDLGLYFADLVV